MDKYQIFLIVNTIYKNILKLVTFTLKRSCFFTEKYFGQPNSNIPIRKCVADFKLLLLIRNYIIRIYFYILCKVQHCFSHKTK